MPQRSLSRVGGILALAVTASFLPPLVATADDAAATGAFIDEVRHSFTLNGKPIPPEIFRDFGDGDLADSASIWVTVDVKAAIGKVCAGAPSKSRRGRSSPLDRRSVSRSCLDRVHIGRSRKGFGCRLAGLARTADRGKEIVQAGRQIGPSHLKLIRAIIDDLVSDAGCGVDGRARDEWVRHSVDDNGALSREAEQDLWLGVCECSRTYPPGAMTCIPIARLSGPACLGLSLTIE